MKKPSGVLKAFIITAAVIAGLCMALVYIVDPFFHYHAPLSGFPYVVDNELTQNPGMAKNMTYDSVITGSSMTLNFDTDDFAELMGLDAVKLCSNGALPHDLSIVFGFVYDENSLARKTNDVKTVFCALDASAFTAGLEETKYPQPDYLYDKNPFNDVSYLLNRDVLLEYILRPMIEREGTDMSYVYGTTWQTEEYFNPLWVMRGYSPSPLREDEESPDAYLEGTAANLSYNIIPYVEAHPETEFVFFFPPYSILYWNNVLNENRLEATFNQYELIAETLLEYPNVRIFYFQNLEEIVTDLNNYADYEHYSPAINRYMTECFADGTCEIKKGEMRAALEEMRDIVDRFDFDALFSEYEKPRYGEPEE